MDNNNFWKRYGNGTGPTATLSFGGDSKTFLITLENFGHLSGISVIEDKDLAEHSYSGWVRRAQAIAGIKDPNFTEEYIAHGE